MCVWGRHYLHKLSRVHSLVVYVNFIFPLNLQILILKFHTVEFICLVSNWKAADIFVCSLHVSVLLSFSYLGRESRGVKRAGNCWDAACRCLSLKRSPGPKSYFRSSRSRTVCFTVPVQGPVLAPVAPISLCLHTTLSLVCAVNCMPHFIVWGAIQLNLSKCRKSVTLSP